MTDPRVITQTRDDILRELAAYGDVDNRPGRPPKIDGGNYKRRGQYCASNAGRRARFRRLGTCLDCGRERDNVTLRCGVCQAGRNASKRASRAKRKELSNAS